MKFFYLMFLLVNTAFIYCLDKNLQRAIKKLDVLAVKNYVGKHNLSVEHKKEAQTLLVSVITNDNKQKKNSFFQSAIGLCFSAYSLYNLKRYIFDGEPIVYQFPQEIGEILNDKDLVTPRILTVDSILKDYENYKYDQTSSFGDVTKLEALTYQPFMTSNKILFTAVSTGAAGVIGIYNLSRGISKLLDIRDRQKRALAIKNLLS